MTTLEFFRSLFSLAILGFRSGKTAIKTATEAATG
jgi:hypothetical protein